MSYPGSIDFGSPETCGMGDATTDSFATDSSTLSAVAASDASLPIGATPVNAGDAPAATSTGVPVTVVGTATDDSSIPTWIWFAIPAAIVAIALLTRKKS